MKNEEPSELSRIKRRLLLRWYVLYVRPGHERKILELLMRKQIEAYVPMQDVRRKYSDRVVTRRMLVAPGIIFVRIRLKDQKSVYVNSFINGFMYNRALHEPEHVPDWQLDQFRRVVESEEHVSMVTPRQGNLVRIMRGRFEGLVGHMVNDGTSRKFQLRIGEQAFLVTVSADDVVKVPEGATSELPDEMYNK